MNRTSPEGREAMFRLSVEGLGVNSIQRTVGVSHVTVLKALREFGETATWLGNHFVRNLSCERIECDELHAVIGARNPKVLAVQEGRKGGMWTWIAFDTASKMLLHWYTGKRDADAADSFFFGLGEKLATIPQEVSTDMHRSYRAMIPHHPLLTHAHVTRIGRTNGTERMNLTLRTSLRRFVRRTTGYSKTVDAHQRMLSMFAFWYNFGRPHASLRRATPAMKAGIATHPWTVRQFVELSAEMHWSFQHSPIWRATMEKTGTHVLDARRGTGVPHRVNFNVPSPRSTDNALDHDSDRFKPLPPTPIAAKRRYWMEQGGLV